MSGTLSVSPPVSPLLKVGYVDVDGDDEQHEEQLNKQLTPLDAAPPMSFADKYTDIMEKNLGLLPTDDQESAGKRTVKAIARVLITIIVFPLFTIGGLFYNIAMGLTKAGVGLVKLIAPGTESLKEYTVENCFKEAFKHLCFAIIDGLSWLFACLVTGAYAFAPREVDKLYDDAEDEINSDKMYEFIAGWASKLSKGKKELTEEDAPKGDGSATAELAELAAPLLTDQFPTFVAVEEFDTPGGNDDGNDGTVMG